MTASEPIPRRADPVRKRPLSKTAQQGLFRRQRSFVDFLPWVEALPEHKAILLADGVSVGAVLEVTPIGTEGRSTDYLGQVRDTVQDALQDSFDEHDTAPWVIQTYTFDEPDLEGPASAVADYVRPAARGTEYTEAYLALLNRHYRGISKPSGLFRDTVVTHSPWRGAVRRNLLVLYRRFPTHKRRRGKHEPAMNRDMALLDLSEAVDKFTHALQPAGVQLRRLSGTDFHDWLLGFFNHGTDLFGGDLKAFMR